MTWISYTEKSSIKSQLLKYSRSITITRWNSQFKSQLL